MDKYAQYMSQSYYLIDLSIIGSIITICIVLIPLRTNAYRLIANIINFDFNLSVPSIQSIKVRKILRQYRYSFQFYGSTNYLLAASFWQLFKVLYSVICIIFLMSFSYIMFEFLVRMQVTENQKIVLYGFVAVNIFTSTYLCITTLLGIKAMNRIYRTILRIHDKKMKYY